MNRGGKTKNECKLFLNVLFKMYIFKLRKQLKNTEIRLVGLSHRGAVNKSDKTSVFSGT